MGTRVAWDHEIVGSNPITRTFNDKQTTQPGRSTVQDAALIRRKRRFDSFSGYSMKTTKGDLKCHDNDGNGYTGPHMGSWCNGSTADF